MILFCLFFRTDITRVDFVVPLRESFSLPFLWAQLAFITYYFRSDISRFARVGVIGKPSVGCAANINMPPGSKIFSVAPRHGSQFETMI